MYFNNFSLGSLQIDGSTSGSGWCWNMLSCAQPVPREPDPLFEQSRTGLWTIINAVGLP